MKEKHRIYSCGMCEFTSSSDKGLKIHKTKSLSLLHHPIDESSEKGCDLCHYNSKSKSDMQDHMKESHFIEYKKTVHGSGPIEFTICGRIKHTYKEHANHLDEEHLLSQIK